MGGVETSSSNPKDQPAKPETSWNRRGYFFLKASFLQPLLSSLRSDRSRMAAGLLITHKGRRLLDDCGGNYSS